MLAVQADAAAAFRQKDWAMLASLTRAFDEPQARFVNAWAQLELGNIELGLNRIRELFQAVAGPITMEPSAPWSLWAFRSRFTATKLSEWGIVDAVMLKLWATLAQLPVHPSERFAHEWVDESLLAVMTALPPDARPPMPWQLGGAPASLDDPAWAMVEEWVRAKANAFGAVRLAPVTGLHALHRPARFGALVTAMVASPEATLKALMGIASEFDALLMLEDLRARVPAEVKGRVERVVFRATPKRVVEAAIVELQNPAAFGALVRHVIPAAAGGKTATALTWIEGTEDAVTAAMPAEHFTAAIAALRLRNAQPAPRSSVGARS